MYSIKKIRFVQKRPRVLRNFVPRCVFWKSRAGGLNKIRSLKELGVLNIYIGIFLSQKKR